MLKVGDTVPDIVATTTDGEGFMLSEQGGLCTVLFFYPKAFTPGCTKETKTFTSNHMELQLAGANVVGISTDDGETQCRFAEEMGTPFPLIADEDRTISKAFGVLWPLVGVAKRVTYVIGPKLRVLGAFRHEVRVDTLTDEVLRFVNYYFQSQRKR
jgi:peroxiredoxin Q/BCP